MMTTGCKHFFLLSCTILFFSFTARPQENGSSKVFLSEMNVEAEDYTWLSVLTGKAIAAPVQTSYGFALLTDGRNINAFTGSGKILWQKTVAGSPSPFLSASHGDFLYAVVSRRKLLLLNPSGLSLWNTEWPFDIKKNVMEGRDGRVFIFGEEDAACVGLNGILKWTIETEGTVSDRLYPVELDDGSILIFLEKEDNGRTVAERISPFGSVIERIVFTGRITSSFKMSQGAILAFGDGSLGMCSVIGIGTENGLSGSKWLIKNSDIHVSPGTRYLQVGKTRLLVFSPSVSGSNVWILNTENGTIKCAFHVPEIKSDFLLSLTALPDAFAATDGRNCVIYDYSGSKLRNVIIPSKNGKKAWDYILYGQNDTVIFTSKSWNITGYKVARQHKGNISYAATDSTYNSYYDRMGDMDGHTAEAVGVRRKTVLEKGNYGKDEILYWAQARHIIEKYIDRKMTRHSFLQFEDSPDVFDPADITDLTSVLVMLPIFGTDLSGSFSARLLQDEDDETVIIAVLKAIQKNGYDPDGSILEVLEQLARNMTPRQTAVHKELCEAVYSVCRFMGRPAFYKRGRSIISNFFMPQYDGRTKDSARDVLGKLATLNM